ncbi:V-type ATP synthase subunit I [bacterium]|nr:V-type ATP synthase subunit I [bacterium]
MKKIGMVAHSSDFDRLIDWLADMGVVQISHCEGEPAETAKKIEGEIATIERAIAFLEQTIEKKPDNLKLSISELDELAGKYPLDKKLSEAEGLRKTIEDLASKKTSLQIAISSLQPYAPLPYKFEQLQGLDFVGIRMGFIPKVFETELEDFNHELCEKLIFNSDSNGFFTLFIYHLSTESNVEQFLDSTDFAEFHFGKHTGTPANELTELSSDISSVKTELEAKKAETQIMAEEVLPYLEALRGYRLLELARAKLEGYAEQTQSTLFLSGWIKDTDFTHLCESTLNKFDAVEIAEIAPGEGDVPPVALKNPPVIEAFEVITDLYGRPRAGMIDPTPFIAPFFPVFFGLCLTDAGYGLLLALFSGGILAFGKMGAGTRKFMRFILYSGLTTVIIGALAGGWFGIDLASMDNGVARALLSIKVFDPLGNAIEFFAASIFLGVIQVSVGFVLSGVIGFREGLNTALKARAVLLSMSWVAVTIGSGVFVANYLVPDAMAAVLPAGLGMLKFGAIGIVAFSLVLGVLGKRGLGAAIADGLGFDGLYGIVSLFGDLLSYARILALGLSTGVIAGVINIIAKELASMIPGVGIVFAALLVIVGHVAYTGLSALGAFVHPARLHFVEYFTRFYEAGGEPFEPLERKIEGVEIVE